MKKTVRWSLGVMVAMAGLAGCPACLAQRETELAGTAMCQAGYAGDTNAILAMLAKGTAVDAHTYSGATALMAAVKDRRMKVAALLLERGARLDQTDSFGDTPLRMLLRMDDFDYKAEFLDLLIAKGAVKDVFALTMANDVAALTKMLDADPTLVKARDSVRNTPLHIAVENLSVEAAKLLLERGADPNTRGKFGYLPIYHTVCFAPLHGAQCGIAAHNLFVYREVTPLPPASVGLDLREKKERRYSGKNHETEISCFGRTIFVA